MDSCSDDNVRDRRFFLKQLAESKLEKGDSVCKPKRHQLARSPGALFSRRWWERLGCKPPRMRLR